MAEKLCVACGADVAASPRVKDQQGRYKCRSCHDASVQKSQTKLKSEAKQASPSEGASRAETASSSSSDHGDVFELMPDSFLGDMPKPCPSCSSPIPSGSVLCMSCGFDVGKGVKLSTGVGSDDPAEPPLKGKPAMLKCPGCGYDLKGLKTPRCPECGKVVVKKSRIEELQESSKKAARDAWVKPLIMIVVGVLGMLLWQGMADPSGGEVVASLIGLAIKVPIGLAIYFVCCLIWIGFDMPWRLITLRLIAVYAIVGLVGLPVAYIPIGIVRLGIMVVVYVGLLMDMLDMEVQDAVIVAVATYIAQLYLALIVAAYLMGLF